MIKKSIVVIVGATASGKSKWAEKLADEFNGELIAADSRQIYKGMDIGTNKSPAHLIDIINPGEDFSVVQYQKLCVKKIKEIHKKSKLPILVGGTGLYVQSITDNLQFPKARPNKKLRKKLEQKLDRRAIRKLEIMLAGANPGAKGPKLFNILQIGIDIDRKELDKRINKRVDEMIKQGLLEERAKIKNPPKTIGYFEETPEKIKTNTRRYAKRQISWFKRDKRIRWVKKYSEAEVLVKEFLLKSAPPH